ncbi:MAG: hypothetical protein K6F76_04145 [Clostridiales bacterium]|nr:hypothetical protein [Clostridiales bacterium]
MKKALILLLCAALAIIIMSSCNSNDGNNDSSAQQDTETVEKIDHDLVSTDLQAACKFMESFYNEPESYDGSTVKISGTVKVINVEEKTYYYLVISDKDENSIDIPFVKDLSDKNDYPQNNDKCTLTGVLKEISDDGIYGVYVNQDGLINEMAEYRETLTVADEKVTLENSQVFSAYGVTLRYKGTENEYFNLYAKNNSSNAAVIRSYNTKINGKSANFSVYEILEPGEEKDISACMTSAIENKTDTISMTFALEDDSNNEIFNTGEINFAAE